jgi:type II secretion system protein H
MPTSATGTSTTDRQRVTTNAPDPVRPMPSPWSLLALPGPAQRGFTLLELMVVVFIIALVAAGAIIALGSTGKDSQLEKERDRLSALMSYAQERGAMLTLEYGIRCGLHGYRIVYFDHLMNQWAPETTDETLKPRKFPDGLQLTLMIEGHQIVLNDKNLVIPKGQATGMPGSPSSASRLGSDMPQSFANQSTDNTPQILLMSNGDVNTFILTIVRPAMNRRATLKSDPDGTIEADEIVEPK